MCLVRFVLLCWAAFHCNTRIRGISHLRVSSWQITRVWRCSQLSFWAAVITGNLILSTPCLSQDWHLQAQKTFSTRRVCRIFNPASETQGFGQQPANQALKLSNLLLLTLMWSELGASAVSETWRTEPVQGNNSCTKRSWQLNPAHWISVCSRINPDHLT